VRTARRILQAGAVLIVLAAISGPLFELDQYQVPKELVLHLAAFGAAVAALAGVRRLPLATVDFLLLGFAALSTVSAVAAGNHWLAARSVGITWAGLAIFWVARGLARLGLARPLLGMLAFAAVLAAATGVLQAYGLDLPLASPRRAPGGTFGNRNFLAHLTAIGLPLITYLAIDSRARLAPWLGALGLAISSAALLFSRSRAAWLAVAAGLTIFLVEGIGVSGLWRDPRIRRRLATLAIAGAVSVVAAVTIPNTLDWRSDSPYLESLAGVANFREGSGRGRLIQYGNTLRMVRDAPLLGVGPGNWPIEYPRYTTPGDPAFDHGDPIPTNPWPSSDWVALVAERGIPAAAFLLAAGIAMLVVGWRRSRQKGRSPEGLAGLAMIATIVVAAVVGTFDAVMLLAAPTFFVWGALGALHPPPRETIGVSRESILRSVRIAAVAGGCGLALLAAIQTASIAVAGDGSSRNRLVWATRLDPGSYRLRILLAARVDGCARKRPLAERAHQLYPNHDAPRRILRTCGRRIPAVKPADP